MGKLIKIIKENKDIILKIGSILVFIIFILIIFLFINDKKGIFAFNNDAKIFKDEYEEYNDILSEDGKKYPDVTIPSNNIIKYITVDEVVNMFEKDEDMVIYFGYATCLYCRSAIEVLLDVANDTDLDVIYYLPISDDTDYSKILKYMKDELITDNDGKKEITMPLVIFSVRGDIVSYWEGTVFSQETPYNELDKSQVRGLSEIYNYGIRDVLASIKERNPQKQS